MKSIVAVVTALCLAAGIAGCSVVQQATKVDVAAAAPAKAAAGAPPASLGASIDSFGFDLLDRLTATDKGNVVISPVSVHAALAMTLNGAAGATAEQMAKVLGLDAADLGTSNAAYAQLLARARISDGDKSFHLASALFADPSVKFSEPFLAVDRDYFGAQIASLDFGAPGAADAINAWVKSQTAGRIDKIVDQTSKGQVLALANAAYFKNEWQSQFKQEDTQPGVFHLTDATAINVPMMHGSENLTGVETTSFVAARIPYRTLGHDDQHRLDTSMYLVVPKEGTTLDELQQSLGVGQWKALIDPADKRGRPASVTMPKLHTEFKGDLAAPLEAMGMVDSFNTRAADLSKMAANPPGPLYISAVDHKTWIDIDEKGTEAAAATVVGTQAGSSAVAAEPLEVRADRPYLFVVYDETDHYAMFVGAVRDPRK
jgi:serine protease inhibitor